MKNLGTIALIYFLGVIVGAWGMYSWPWLKKDCKCPEIVASDSTRYTEYIYDSIPVPMEVRVPVTVEVRVPYWIPLVIDTASVVRDYFSTVYYQEQYEDSLITLLIEDSLNQNRIVWRNIERGFKRPSAVHWTIVNNKLDEGPELFLSGGLAYQTKPGITAGIFYNKKQALYGYQLMIMPSSDPIHTLTYGWKLQRKK